MSSAEAGGVWHTRGSLTRPCPDPTATARVAAIQVEVVELTKATAPAGLASAGYSAADAAVGLEILSYTDWLRVIEANVQADAVEANVESLCGLRMPRPPQACHYTVPVSQNQDRLAFPPRWPWFEHGGRRAGRAGG